tara:strand:+ start:3516 stop:4775 length:1260 start_codon:yes stop_codon:yes gene_type:complete
VKRVVVTGVGMVTPLGCGVDYNWNKLIQGVSGAGKISRFSVKDSKCKVACEIPIGDGKDGTFNAEDWIEKKEIKKIDDFIKYSLAASEESFQNSNLPILNDPLSFKSGCIIGSGMGGLPGIEQTSIDYSDGKKISPFFITGRIINMPSGFISIKYNLKGPSYSTVSACASGAHAIGESFRLIQHGQADIMVTGGAESTICPTAIEGFTACRALSLKFNDDPEKSSRPFDEDRDGFVMAEGAGTIILEELEHAKKRNADILCEIKGYGMSSDAFHYTLPEPSGDGAYRAMLNCINDAKISLENISYINAHGTSTPAGDKVEVLAVDSIFKNRSVKVNLSSTKSQIGHLLGAAGAVEAIYSIKSIRENTMPYTINLDNPISSSNINFVKNEPMRENVNNVLSNSFGFGGTNVSLIFSKFNG